MVGGRNERSDNGTNRNESRDSGGSTGGENCIDSALLSSSSPSSSSASESVPPTSPAPSHPASTSASASAASPSSPPSPSQSTTPLFIASPSCAVSPRTRAAALALARSRGWLTEPRARCASASTTPAAAVAAARAGTLPPFAPLVLRNGVVQPGTPGTLSSSSSSSSPSSSTTSSSSSSFPASPQLADIHIPASLSNSTHYDSDNRTRQQPHRALPDLPQPNVITTLTQRFDRLCANSDSDSDSHPNLASRSPRTTQPRSPAASPSSRAHNSGQKNITPELSQSIMPAKRTSEAAAQALLQSRRGSKHATGTDGGFTHVKGKPRSMIERHGTEVALETSAAAIAPGPSSTLPKLKPSKSRARSPDYYSANSSSSSTSPPIVLPASPAGNPSTPPTLATQTELEYTPPNAATTVARSRRVEGGSDDASESDCSPSDLLSTLSRTRARSRLKRQANRRGARQQGCGDGKDVIGACACDSDFFSMAGRAAGGRGGRGAASIGTRSARANRARKRAGLVDDQAKSVDNGNWGQSAVMTSSNMEPNRSAVDGLAYRLGAARLVDYPDSEDDEEGEADSDDADFIVDDGEIEYESDASRPGRREEQAEEILSISSGSGSSSSSSPATAAPSSPADVSIVEVRKGGNNENLNNTNTTQARVRSQVEDKLVKELAATTIRETEKTNDKRKEKSNDNDEDDEVEEVTLTETSGPAWARELRGSREWLGLDGKDFAKVREEAAQRLLRYFDREVLNGCLLGATSSKNSNSSNSTTNSSKISSTNNSSNDGSSNNTRLPDGTERVTVEWSGRLYKTAGITYLRRRRACGSRVAGIQLSVKVVDEPARLYNTLAHELCHAAAWIVDDVAKPPHGADFKRWAQVFRRWDERLKITTCHDYAIRYKFNYVCEKCGQSYGRHSRSINTQKQVCGVCRGKLVLQKKKKA